MEERIRVLLLRKVKGGEGNRREENEKKGEKRDLPDQCQTASYAPEFSLGTANAKPCTVLVRVGLAPGRASCTL